MPHPQNVYRPGRAMQDEFGAGPMWYQVLSRARHYHRVAAHTGEDGHDTVAG